MNKDTRSFPRIFLPSLEIGDRNVVLAVQLQPTKTFRNSIRANFVHKFRINLPQTIGGSITRYESIVNETSLSRHARNGIDIIESTLQLSVD